MTDHPRLIEHAFPLKQASLDSVHEKNVRHGHISTLHIWPARRPLAACRADRAYVRRTPKVLASVAGGGAMPIEFIRLGCGANLLTCITNSTYHASGCLIHVGFGERVRNRHEWCVSRFFVGWQ